MHSKDTTNVIKNKGPIFQKKNSGHYLDTLAQLYESEKTESESKEKLRKRSRSKFFTSHLVLKLVEIKESSLIKSYWNSYHCASILNQENDKITGKYCNNRWCQVCNRIRTAKTIKGYLPQIKKLIDPYFVTISRPNVLADTLEFELDIIIKQFRRIYRHFIDSKSPIVGIRKIECTYNVKRDDFHPHIHLIVESEATAQKIIDLWLKYNPEASSKAQDKRPVDNEGSALELFKYFTKLTTKQIIEGKSVYSIHAESLNIIFESMRKRRVYQPMGIKKVSEEVEPQEAFRLDENSEHIIDQWIYSLDDSDWINSKGKKLSGYKPTESILKILNISNDGNKEQN